MKANKLSTWPSFTIEEADAVYHTLLSNDVNYWTGNECREFEKEFANWIGVSYAISLTNGTVALDISLKALNIGAGDEVIVTPRTFIASVSCVVNAGAIPIFADVDINSGNISASSIEKVLTHRTKAVICVHLAGWPCDMDPILALAAKNNFKIIEDCAQAHGARYKGRRVGSIGHIGAWSFCQDKIMTTGGEGGMVTTNDKSLWLSMWAYKDHGKSYEAVYQTKHPPGFRWLHESFGTNFRMTEMQGTIGRIQLRRMNEWTSRRQENANILRKALLPYAGNNGLIRIPLFVCSNKCLTNFNDDRCTCDCTHAYYKFYVYLKPEKLKIGWTRAKIIDQINANGVLCYEGSCSEVYLEKAFDNTIFQQEERLPNAKELGETSLMFLVHPTITESEIENTVTVIQNVISRASA